MAGLTDSLMFRVGIDLSDVERELNKLPGKAARTAKNVTVALGAIAAAATVAAAGVAKIGMSAIQTRSDFEALESRLSTLLGSASAAQQRMTKLAELASSTPFELNEIVEADVALEAFGVNADETRTAVMDLAGAMGLDVVEAANAVGRAFAGGAGSADILRERGVLAMMEMRTGVKATELSLEEFREQLIATLTDPDGKIAGGTMKLSQTFGGMVSNMQDNWTQFELQIANSGLFDGLKGGMAEVLALINENRASINALANEIGINMLAAVMLVVQGMGQLYDWVTQFQLGWLAVKGTVAEVGIAATKGASALWDFVRPIYDLYAKINPLAAKGVEIVDNIDARVQSATLSFQSMADESADAIYAISKNLGDGADAAERINAAIDAARSQGTFSPIELPSTSMADTGTDDVVADFDAMAEGAAEALARIMGSAAAGQAAMATVGEATKAEIEEVEAEIVNMNAVLADSGARTLMAISQIAGIAADKQAESNAKAAQRLLAFQKAAAITAALINGAVGVTKAIADLGPVAGAIAAVGVAATTAAEVAAISSQEIPSFVSGGLLGMAGGLMDAAPTATRQTHQLAYVEAGRETAVLNEGASRAGFADQVNRANRRESSGSEVIVLQPDRHFGRGWVEPARTGGIVRQQARRLAMNGGHTGRTGW